MKMILHILGILSILCIGTASSCDQDTVAGTNNLDRPTDLLILKSAEQSHSYLVTTNPRANTLRFFDITAGLFVAAPNLAFPLATVVGPGSHQLAKSERNESLFFVLDTTLEEIFTIRTKAEGGTAAFTHARAPFTTPKSAHDFAVFQNDSQAPWLIWVAANTPFQIVQYQMDAQQPHQITANATIALDAPATDLQFSPEGDWAVVTKDTANLNLEIFSTENASSIANVTLPFTPTHIRIRANATSLDTYFYEIWVLSQSGDRIATAVFEPETSKLRFLGSTETSASAQSLFVPQSNEGESTSIATCCNGLNDELKSNKWITTVNTEGDLLYWYEQISGTDFESLNLSLLPFNNYNESPSATLSCNDQTGDSKPSCGTVSLTSLAGSVALWNQWRFDQNITATWEGAPNGLSQRTVTFNDSDRTFQPHNGLFPLDTGLENGAQVVLEYAEINETCSGLHLFTLGTIEAQSLTLSELSNDISACLPSRNLKLSVKPNNGFSLQDERHGNLGSVYANNNGEFSLLLGHWEATFSLESQNEWQEGEQLILNISNPISPVGLFLSQNFTYQSGGFGTYGNYPAALNGAEVKMTTTDGDTVAIRQLYLVTETGSLFEFNEGETDVANVLSYK